MINKLTIDEIYKELEKQGFFKPANLNFNELKLEASTSMDKNLTDIIKQEEGLYSYLLPYNLENRINQLNNSKYLSLKEFSNKGLVLTSEFLKVVLVRTMTNNPNLKDNFTKYIDRLDSEINDFLLYGKEDKLLGYLFELSQLLAISIKFFVALSNYFTTVYEAAVKVNKYNHIDIAILEENKLEKYHDFNILGYFKEDEKGFFENIIKNLNHDYGEKTVSEILNKMDNKGVLLVGGLFDAFLYNLKNKDKKFTGLYNIINSANKDYVDGKLSEYRLNITVGYIVMGLRYSFPFYLALKDYTNSLYSKYI